MDRLKLISKIVPQLSQDSLWREFFDKVIELAESGDIVESPFKDELRKNGFLKEFNCSFTSVVNSDGEVAPVYDLTEGTYYCENLLNPATGNHYFTESTTRLVGEPGTYSVVFVNFCATDFLGTYLRTIGPGTFSLHSLATLMQAAYICGVELNGVTFDGLGYFVEYNIGELHSAGITRVGLDEFYTTFFLIPYNEVGETILGDVVIPRKSHNDVILSSKARKVLSYDNGVVSIESVQPTLPVWNSGIVDNDVDLLTVRRYFNGYQFNGKDVFISNLSLKKWYDHDAPILNSAELVHGFAVTPLLLELDFLKDSTGGISISGNQSYRFDLSNFDTTYFKATIEGVEVDSSKSYVAPTALFITTLLNNDDVENQRSCTLDLISEGEVYTVTIVQEPAGCIVAITDPLLARVLAYSERTMKSTPESIEIDFLSVDGEKVIYFDVRSVVPFKIGVEVQARDLPAVKLESDNECPEWQQLNWETAQYLDAVTNNYSQYESEDGFIHPDEQGSNVFATYIVLPGYFAQITNQGDVLIQTVYIYIADKKFPLLALTQNTRHLEMKSDPYRVLGGTRLEVVHKTSQGNGFVGLGSVGTFNHYTTTETYTKEFDGQLQELQYLSLLLLSHN